MYETTVPDPLETTVPDLRPRRLPARRRRAIEVCAPVLLVPGLLITRWIDDTRLGNAFDQPERTTVVPHGATATIGRSQWRMLGRDAEAASKFPTTPPGSVRLTLLLQVRALDANGVKDATNVTYRVRDREGHVWTALGQFPDAEDPPAGTTVQATVTANVPPPLVNKVVLEVRAGAPLGAAKKEPARVLRFAH